MAHGDVVIQKKFGRVFAMIRPLPDFTLLRLIPNGGIVGKWIHRVAGQYEHADRHALAPQNVACDHERADIEA